MCNSITPKPSSTTPRAQHKFLVIRNGAYSNRMASIVEKHGGSELVPFDAAEGEDIDLVKLQALLQSTANISHVGIVH